MKPSISRPIEKNLVLVGAGNAHLVFLKRWGMRPMPGVAVTLVNQFAESPYSAMVPAHIAGDYSRDEITIDLVRLCAAVGVRLVREKVTEIDPRARQVRFAARVAMAYDALSLGIGSVPACPAEGAAAFSVVLRPLGVLIERLNQLERKVVAWQSKAGTKPFDFVVVGGGASGCELALAIRKRLGAVPGFRMTLLQGNDRLLPHLSAAVGRAFLKALTGRGIAVRVNAKVTGGQAGALVLESGDQVPVDAVLWATNAAPPPLLRDTGLALDASAFLLVRDTLQSVSDPAVFGTGDCVSFPSYPDLPKNGVYAVREGAVLFDNVAAFFAERPLRAFRPQRYCLTLLNTADGEAVVSYGPLTAKGRWARRLKDRIDRAWIERYTRFPALATTTDGDADEPLMRCGGCGSKISGDVLSAVLKRLDVGDDPRILMGCRAGEDAAVFQMRPELFSAEPAKQVEVQTVDFFKAFIDDPYLFGRVAALHAVSDLYAMNARPFSALAIATLPYARGPVQEAQLHELLSGAVRSFRELDIVLTGGHTTEGNELALGFAVTGYGEEDRLFQKGALRSGDRLILTKPLGTGALLAAWIRSACRGAWLDRLTAGMLQPNRAAAEVFRNAGVLACTDVTGFGLAGHLLEMLDASRLSACLDPAAVPLYPGFAEVVAAGIVSTLQSDNAKVACRIDGPVPLPAWLFDPQTSGGLLAGIRPDAVTEVLAQLRDTGHPDAAVIGEVAAADTPSISLRR